MPLKVVSWNIWYFGNLDNVNTFLEQTDADIIGLQEIVSTDGKVQLSKYLTEELGYQFVYSPVFQIEKNGKTVDIGNAILSKYPIQEHKIHNLSQTDNRIAIEAIVKVNNKILQLVCTHLFHTHQKSSLIQNIQVENLIKIFMKDNTILMGDFNALPTSDVIKSIKNAFNDTDSKSIPTWSVYQDGCKGCSSHGVNYKLDYIFISKNLKVNSYQVENSNASDHLPISANIEI